MGNYRKGLAWVALAALLLQPSPARADMFGGDVVVLTGVLSELMKSYEQANKMFHDGRTLLRQTEAAYNVGMETYHIANGFLHWNAAKTKAVIQGSLRETFPEGMYLYDLVKNGGVIPTYAQGMYTYQIARWGRGGPRMAINGGGAAAGGASPGTTLPEGTGRAAAPLEDPTCRSLINTLTMDGAGRTLSAMLGLSQRQIEAMAPEINRSAEQATRVIERFAREDIVDSKTQERQRVFEQLLRLKAVCDGTNDMKEIGVDTDLYRAKAAELQAQAKAARAVSDRLQAEKAKAEAAAAGGAAGTAMSLVGVGNDIAVATAVDIKASAADERAQQVELSAKQAAAQAQMKKEACATAAQLATTIQALMTWEMAENQREQVRMQAQQARVDAIRAGREITGGRSDLVPQWERATALCNANIEKACADARLLSQQIRGEQQELAAAEATLAARRQAASQNATSAADGYWSQLTHAVGGSK